MITLKPFSNQKLISLGVGLTKLTLLMFILWTSTVSLLSSFVIFPLLLMEALYQIGRILEESDSVPEIRGSQIQHESSTDQKRMVENNVTEETRNAVNSHCQVECDKSVQHDIAA